MLDNLVSTFFILSKRHGYVVLRHPGAVAIGSLILPCHPGAVAIGSHCVLGLILGIFKRL